MIVLFLALTRTVGEYFRLRYVLGADAAPVAYAPYIAGLGAGLLGTWAAVVLCFARRFTAATGASVLTIVGLIIYKILVFK